DYDQDVDQVIFLGVPHKGAPTDYLQWEAGEFPPGIINFLTEKFFEIEAKKNNYSSLYDYIHLRPILSIQELLPVFDYVKDKDTGVIREYFDGYPRNFFLENLNNNISNLLNSGVEIINFIGNAGNNTIEKIRVIPSTKDGLWEYGEPDGFYKNSGDNGLERGPGDETVTILGATLDSINAEEVSATHRRIPTIAENQIYNILTGKTSSTSIDNGFNLSEKILLLQLLSPIDFVITAPNGLKIGKNFSDGSEYNQIPNAFYSGYFTNDEYITVLNPMDGEYKIELQGTGTGGEYGVLTSYIKDDFATTTGFQGVIGVGQISNLEVEVDNNNPSNIEIVSTDPITSSTLLNHINLINQWGWILDEDTYEKLTDWAESIVRMDNKSKTRFVDKKLAKMLYDELPKMLEKNKINISAYNLLKKDLEYLLIY
ncbi:MAG: hypothetical protein AAB861_03970, partial [Patescibacteria group bacterium]